MIPGIFLKETQDHKQYDGLPHMMKVLYLSPQGKYEDHDKSFLQLDKFVNLFVTFLLKKAVKESDRDKIGLTIGFL